MLRHNVQMLLQLPSRFDCPPPEGARGKVPSIVPGLLSLLVGAARPVHDIHFVADFEVAPCTHTCQKKTLSFSLEDVVSLVICVIGITPEKQSNY